MIGQLGIHTRYPLATGQKHQDKHRYKVPAI